MKFSFWTVFLSLRYTSLAEKNDNCIIIPILGGMSRQLKLLLRIIQQPLADNGLDFPFSSIRQHVVIVDVFVYTRTIKLLCKKAVKTNLDFVVYTCVAFESVQLILYLIYTYSIKDGSFKLGLNLHFNNGWN